MPSRSLRELGYKVERFNGKHTAYMVYGKRGAIYGLIRNAHRPELLFSVNARHFTANDKIHGFSWFIEKEGEVYPLR